ncbi:MAG: LuxR C-terminal-related transcriptional regulator [Chloroflexota bacterium]
MSTPARSGLATLWRYSGRAPDATLPHPLTSFIGREQERATLVSLLPQQRLLTLTGPGGVGKSRLALEVSRTVAQDAAVDVLWVELVDVLDSALVVERVSLTVGIKERPGQPLLETLTELLQGRSVLLVLDNCEHLVDGCADLVLQLVTRCPDLTLMATSRLPLGVPGERRWPVPPLSTQDSPLAPGVVMPTGVRSAAAELFVDRARLLEPGLRVNEENGALIAEICRRLDGLPLAVELAAARSTILEPRRILERLENRFALLAQSVSRGPYRHRSLRAVMDWSHDLLEPTAQAVFRRAAVFVGSWNLEAMEAVCAGDAVASADMVDLLQALVDHSLVVAADGAEGRRYRLLETIHAYAQERLIESGEEERVRARHCAWYLQMAEEGGAALWGREQGPWLLRLGTDLSNIRAAITWCVDQASQPADMATAERADGEDPSLAALRFGGALTRLWQARGYLNEGRRLLTAILDTADLPVPARVDTLNAFIYLAVVQGDMAAVERAVRASRELAQTIHYLPGLYLATVSMGGLAMWQADYEMATTMFAEAARMLPALEPSLPRYIGQSLAGFLTGATLQAQGDFEQAESTLAAALNLAREAGDEATQIHLLTCVGNLAFSQGNLAQSEAWHQEALRLQRNLEDLGGILQALDGAARAAGASGRYEHAAWLYGAVEGLSEATGVQLAITRWQIMDQPVLAALRQALGEEAFTVAWNDGRTADPQAILDRALAEQAAPPPAPRSTPAAPGSPARRGPADAKSPLTAREHEVAALVAQGRTNRQIAEALVITERTAETHVRNIREKLGFTSRAQIAAWVTAQGAAGQR